MADIKMTKDFVSVLASVARKHHGYKEIAIKLAYSIWMHKDNNYLNDKKIWCSSCGTHFVALEEFNERHGGE